MGGAVLVAIAASIGNLLQGWDNATIAGKLTVEKKSLFDLIILLLGDVFYAAARGPC
jgi:hypothetical protein